MLRLTSLVSSLLDTPATERPAIQPPSHAGGPVVIWNLIRRCNLTCRHCYALSADADFSGELSTAEVMTVMGDLWDAGVRVLILSGGEPMLRPDIWEIAHAAKAKGFYVGLSSNGTLITEHTLPQIAAVGFDYVGVSLDGLEATHDRFRRRQGAFAASLSGIRLCRDAGLKVGVRFTLTRDNAADWPHLLDLVAAENIDKVYLSHLNYAGRGNHNRRDDARHQLARWAVTLMIERCLADLQAGRRRDYVTGNNDADGVFLYLWAREHFPDQADSLLKRLRRWGGNASGVMVANIDTQGIVHPDTMWWTHPLGSVRERRFADIWADRSDPLMDGLKQRPRPVEGRCAQCFYLDVCNGNTRTRAFQLTRNPWAEDPGCYLDDTEIGLTTPVPRLELTGFGDC